MFKRSKGVRVGTGLTVGALALTCLVACGSSKGQSATAPTTGGSGSTTVSKALSGAPVKIMVTGTIQSAALSLPETVPAPQAAADAINAAGGINGHRVEIISCNDNFDPSQALACVQEGIQDKVVAFVGGVELFAQPDNLYTLLQNAGIPWVAPDVEGPAQATSKMAFPIDGGALMSFEEAGQLLVIKGGSNVGFTESNNAPGIYNGTFITAGVKLAGGQVVSAVPTATPTNLYSSYTAQLLGKGVQGVSCACGPPDPDEMLAALHLAGFHGVYTVLEDALPNAQLIALGASANNVYVISAEPYIDSPDSSVQEFKSEMTEYAPGVSGGQTAADGWLGVHIVADQLEGKATLTAATLLQALNSATSVNGHGLVPNLNFTANGPIASLPRITNTFVNVYKWDPTTKTLVSQGPPVNALVDQK